MGIKAVPFRIHVEDAKLKDLADRVHRTRFPDQIADSGWDYGTDTRYLKALCDYWADEFDWRRQEARLNAFPQFKATIDGHDIHFVHLKSEGPKSTPLLMLHGWPSTFVQMLDVAPLLTAPSKGGQEASFDVVIMSLPGYGLSGRPASRGMGVAHIAPLATKLMTDVLGYERFAVRASDLGAGIAQNMALQDPKSVSALHLSGTNPFIPQVPADLSPAEKTFVGQAQAWMQTEMAYAMEHTSRPQTLAAALNDSPAGLASWIVEKFRRWSDCGGDVETRFSKDALLTHLTIYWVTETIGSSIRLYYESAREQGGWGKPAVPVAMLMSDKDFFPTPREWAARSYDIVRWTKIDKGGHFLEQEEPKLVADDLRSFFGTLG